MDIAINIVSYDQLNAWLQIKNNKIYWDDHRSLRFLWKYQILSDLPLMVLELKYSYVISFGWVIKLPHLLSSWKPLAYVFWLVLAHIFSHFMSIIYVVVLYKSIWTYIDTAWFWSPRIICIFLPWLGINSLWFVTRRYDTNQE